MLVCVHLCDCALEGEGQYFQNFVNVKVCMSVHMCAGRVRGISICN